TVEQRGHPGSRLALRYTCQQVKAQLRAHQRRRGRLPVGRRVATFQRPAKAVLDRPDLPHDSFSTRRRTASTNCFSDTATTRCPATTPPVRPCPAPPGRA